MAGSRIAKPSELPGLIEARLAPFKGLRLCIALSGGADSTALLHLVARAREALGLTLTALHVHHGISPNADAWQAFCQTRCDRLSVPLRCTRVKLAPDSKLGLEAEARARRREAFRAEPTDWLLLAQHQDDQAETLLLQLLRGSGPRGLAAMAARVEPRAGEPGWYRPLLDIPGATLRDWLRGEGLDWIEDESNLDTLRARNFLRHDILPRLARHVPGWRDTLGRAALHQAESADMLDELARLDRGGMHATLRLDTLRALPEPRARNALRGWIADRGLGAPNRERLVQFLAQARAAAHDRAPLLAWPDGRLRVWRGEVYCLPAHDPPAPGTALSWQGEHRLPWGDGQVLFRPTRGTGIARARLEGRTITLRPRGDHEERLRLDPSRPSRSLASLWREGGVPPWERDRIPRLYSEDQLIWVGGLGIAHDWRTGTQETGLEVAWSPSPAEKTP